MTIKQFGGVFGRNPEFNTVTANSADINGGTIDGTVIGGSTPAAISGTTGTFSGNLTVDTNTLFVNAATNNIGIGTNSPSTKLDVAAATSAQLTLTRTDSTAGNGVVRSAGNTNVTNASISLGGGVSNLMAFSTNGSERVRIDSSGNVLIGGTTAGTSSAGNLVLVNGTAPTGNVTNGITLYAQDVSASSELKVRDEAGNVTTLSPHNFELIPEGPSEDMAWSYYSERDGKRINVDMLKAIRLLEQITGEKLVHMA